MQRYKGQLALCVLWVGCFASLASAQSNPQQLAETNRQAMEAYTNLDVEQARATLEKAVRQAEKAGIRGPALARTLSNLAVVLVAGSGDQAGGVAAFERALKEDPKVEPDPLVATPEVMTAFNAAKGRAGKSADAPAAPATKPSGSKRPTGAAAPVEGNLDHTPAAEQLTQTAVPVFVKRSPELNIARMKLSYRSVGMQKPKTVDLAESDDGFTFLIPCADVFEPVVEYFIVAVDDRGKSVGNAGTAANPIAVPIVRERTQPSPALPGQVPPTQCSADNECPPGLPDCRTGNAGMGESCTQDAQCQAGLICEDDFCTAGERDDDDDDESDSRFGKRFFADINFGVGATSVRKGRAPDRTPESVINDVERASRVEPTDPRSDIDTMTAEIELRQRGFDCDAAQTEDMRLRLTDCTVAVSPGGFVAVPIVNVAAGYFVTPQLALALTGRFQLAKGEGPLAGTLLGLRAEYLISQPAETGLRGGLIAGFSIGQMQARPSPKGNEESQGPFATNAGVDKIGVAVTVGARLSYRFIPNLGINITPALNFGLPNFLFALDATGGLELAF
jgi:hypothetical protein